MVRRSPRQARYLQRRGARWRYRRWVPKEWRYIIGHTVWVQALGDISKAEALARVAELARAHDNQIRDLDAMGDARARLWRAEQLKQMAAFAKQEAPGRTVEIETHLSRELRKLGVRPSAVDQARWAASFMRAGLDATAPGQVADPAEREISEALIERAEKEVNKIDDTAAGRTLLTAMPAWQKDARQADKTFRKHRERVHALVKFLNEDRPLSHVTEVEAHAFLRHVRDTPDKLGRPRTIATVQKFKDSLVAYYNWANTIPGWKPENAFRSFRVGKDTRPKQQRKWDSFSDAQAFEFRASCHHRWTHWREMIPGRGRDLKLALDLIMALGLRPSEACQLHIQNVTKDVEGRLLISITSFLTDDDDEWGGSVKNEHSVRQLPVPDALVAAVEEQVEAAKVADSNILFPTFSRTKEYVDALASDITNSVKPKCSFAGNRRLVLYSHRHRFRDICGKIGITDSIIHTFFGHRDDIPISSRYGNRDTWNGLKLAYLNKVFPYVFVDPESPLPYPDLAARIEAV